MPGSGRRASAGVWPGARGDGLDDGVVVGIDMVIEGVGPARLAPVEPAEHADSAAAVDAARIRVATLRIAEVSLTPAPSNLLRLLAGRDGAAPRRSPGARPRCRRTACEGSRWSHRVHPPVLGRRWL